MPTLGLFKKAKKEKPHKLAEEQLNEPSVKPSTENVFYLKALPLREISDLEVIRSEVRNGNILILRVTPLASRSVEDVKQAVGELHDFAEAIGGDIARLGEERVVVCPPGVRIWREKAPVQSEPLPTAA